MHAHAMHTLKHVPPFPATNFTLTPKRVNSRVITLCNDQIINARPTVSSYQYFLACTFLSTSLWNTTPLHIPAKIKSIKTIMCKQQMHKTNDSSAGDKYPDKVQRYAVALAHDPQTIRARLYRCACSLHGKQKHSAVLPKTCMQTCIHTYIHKCIRICMRS